MTIRRVFVLVGTALTFAAGAVIAAQGRGPGGMGPGPGQQVELMKQFDKNGDKRLDSEERKAALAYLSTQGGSGGFGGRMGPMGMGPRGGGASGSPGRKLSPKDVTTYPATTPLYDRVALRTVFLQFDDSNWEEQLMAFKRTDVDVPATMTIDGTVYKDATVHFHGMSSFMGVPAGLKHSINISVDDVNKEQRVFGYRSLVLLNSHEDPTYLRSVLYYQAARELVPAPKANYARVVINGESWGAFVNVEHFSKEFTKEWFNTTDGARWKVPGNPGARGGLEYLGEDPAEYKRHYEIKSKDDPKSWKDFANLCKVLNETPAEKLDTALAPILDVDGALRFLALDNAFVNGDGYWTRSSDYSIYEDVKGKFHVIPWDANETFSTGMGPGGRGGPFIMSGGDRGGPPDRGGFPPPPPGMGGRGGPMMMGGGPELDPLVGLNDAAKPLRSKLLAVPALRAKYLGYVKQIATKWLDWNTLGPIAQQYQAVIADEVKIDTRKLDSFEEFQSGVEALKKFAEQRRAFLLK